MIKCIIKLIVMRKVLSVSSPVLDADWSDETTGAEGSHEPVMGQQKEREERPAASSPLCTFLRAVYPPLIFLSRSLSLSHVFLSVALLSSHHQTVRFLFLILAKPGFSLSFQYVPFVNHTSRPQESLAFLKKRGTCSSPILESSFLRSL